MLEECDSISCVNVFADFHDGFGGFAVSLLQEISDEIRGVTLV
jgi:hypothetical protein